MRLPLATEIDSRDGSSNKDERLTNALKESSSHGDKAVIRPGLILQAESTGVGGGLVAFNNELVSVYGATLGKTITDYSTDYGDWNLIGIPNVLSGCFGSGVFLLVTYSGSVYTSLNGTTWTEKTSIGSACVVAFGGSTFCAIPLYGSGEVYTSTDAGESWTLHSGAITVADPPFDQCQIHHNGTYFIASVGDSALTPGFFRSLDGVTWETTGIPATLTESTSVKFASNATQTFCIFDLSDVWKSENNGTTWTSVLDLFTQGITSIACGGGIVVACNEIDTYTSSDGISFTFHGSPSGIIGSPDYMFFDGVNFLLSRPTIDYSVSDDGVTWTHYADASGATWGDFTSNGVGVSVGFSGDANTASINGEITSIASLATIPAGYYDFAQSPI